MTSAGKGLFAKTQDIDGPLSRLLLIMTIVTGLVDAFAYLVLGHVFVANMTGNDVFFGFALAGAHGFSIAASLVAIAAFLFGAAGGGKLSSLFASDRGRLLSISSMFQSVLFAIGIAPAASISGPTGRTFVTPLYVVSAQPWVCKTPWLVGSRCRI